LAVIDLIAQGVIKTSFIEFTPDLGELFTIYWSRVMPPDQRSNIVLPISSTPTTLRGLLRKTTTFSGQSASKLLIISPLPYSTCYYYITIPLFGNYLVIGRLLAFIDAS
jgi:hypothetical protein